MEAETGAKRAKEAKEAKEAKGVKRPKSEGRGPNPEARMANGRWQMANQES
jgi:hypothetical protein